MANPSQTYAELEKEWRSTCRIILGDEIGALSDYEKWLSGNMDQFFVRKSTTTNRPVVLSNDSYCEKAKITGMGEADFAKKFEPLSVNEMKDIDSLLEAVQERAYYCGDVIIGNSKHVEQSSGVSDSFFVYKSVRISGCKNVAYSQYMRLSENIFGTDEGGASKFGIRCSVLFNNVRSLELWISGNSSDCYYSYGLEDCRECMFSFNATGKSHCIGNLPLPKDKYLSIKKKILAELREELVKNKSLPSLMDIVSKADDRSPEAAQLIKGKVDYSREKQDMAKIEAEFSNTTSVVLGRPLKGIENYAPWLKKWVETPYPAASALSKTRVQMANYPGFSDLPKNRLVTQNEALRLGELARISQAEAEKLSIRNVHEFIGAMAYFPPERRIGTYSNLIDCSWGSASTDCYKTVICAVCKCSVYSMWTRSSEHCMGCGIVFDSDFCVKCYDSVNLTRCFEVDASRQCSDCWFCHNVEGMQNSIFCFNTKSKQYAVANAEVGRERFLEVKKMVQDWILAGLEKKNEAPLSIYDVGCVKKQV